MQGKSEGSPMETLTEKRDALLRRREELLTEWAQTKAALKKAEGAGGCRTPQPGGTLPGLCDFQGDGAGIQGRLPPRHEVFRSPGL